MESLLKPHQEQTGRRIAAEAVMLPAQDTTGLSYNTLQRTQALGALTDRTSGGQFRLTLLAFRLDGIPWGNPWSQLWTLPARSDTAQRNDQSVDERDSARWIRAFQVSCQWAQRMPQIEIIVCGDRESDIYELYDQNPAAPKNGHVLVRGQHDRSLSRGTQLRAALEQVGDSDKTLASPRSTEMVICLREVVDFRTVCGG